jgi:hypothetical protein
MEQKDVGRDQFGFSRSGAEALSRKHQSQPLR